MKQAKNVPQLRFSGFDDEWEKKKLNEYLEPSKQKNLDNKYSKNDVLSVSGEFGIVNQIEFQGRSFAGEYVNNYGVVETNDIVYTKSPLNANPYGIIKSNFGKTGIVSTLYAVYKSKKNVDPCFIQTYFELNKRLNDYLRPLVRKGAKNDMKVSSEDALLGNVVFPSKLEQQKIGTFLSYVDSLIQAKTKKLESLKAVKKSLLQKCFPKAGEKVPEMRFESNQKWDSISFEDCFSFLSNNSFSRDELNYEKGYIKNLHYGDVLIKFGEILNVSTESLPYITQINSPKEYSKSMLKNGDIVIADAAEDNTVGKCTEIQNCTELLAAGLHTIAMRPKIEFAPTFLGFCINSESFHNQLLPLIQGTKVSSISKSAIVDTVIYYPISITEQQKIGQFFSKYASLISAQQKEIDKLKDIKKSLLQKMFV